MDQPPVTLDVRLPNGGWATRFENEWPLARTQYVKYYLDAINPEGTGIMSLTPSGEERKTTYSADVYRGAGGSRLGCSEYGVSFVTDPLTEDVEIAGYMKLGMWVSSTSTDMDIFATLRVTDENNKEVFYNSLNSQPSPIMVGFLKVSHRKVDPGRSTVYRPHHTHLKTDYQPLNPNEKVQVEVEIWPATAVIKKGHRIWLTIQPHDSCFAAWGGPNGAYLHAYDESYHKDAWNTIYTGGTEPSYLQLPVIPPKN